MATHSLANQVVGLFKEALAAWKTFISTRQEAYERKMDKRKEKAIQYGEEGFEEMGKMFNFIHDKLTIPDENRRDFDRIKTEIYRLKGKFNKYD